MQRNAKSSEKKETGVCVASETLKMKAKQGSGSGRRHPYTLFTFVFFFYINIKKPKRRQILGKKLMDSLFARFVLISD